MAIRPDGPLMDGRFKDRDVMALRAINPHRNLWLDFFRGLALVFIVVDHISNSPTSLLTLRNYALCDASEVFVFISGVATMMAFRKYVATRGLTAAWARLLYRSGKIYVAYLLVALALTLVGVLLNRWGWTYAAVWLGHAAQFLDDPLLYLFHIAVFYLQPALSNILPLYVFLMLAAPLLICSIERAPVLTFFLSLLIWRFAPHLNALLPSDTGDGYFFDPFAWQLIFTLGLLFGRWGGNILAFLDRHPVWITWLMGIFAALAAIQAWIWHRPELYAVFPPPEVKGWLYPISKTHLDICRAISFLAIAWLIRMSVSKTHLNWSRPPVAFIALIGRNGLPCFALGTIISLIGDAITLNTAWMSSLYEGMLIDLAAVSAMTITAYCSESWRDVKARLMSFRMASDAG